jgi:LysM repeat protein
MSMVDREKNMNRGAISLRTVLLFGILLLTLFVATACGSEEEPSLTKTETTPPPVMTIATPVELIASPISTETGVLQQSEPTVVRPTVTSPVPTFTPLPTETPTPTPPPEPTDYIVESGDTLLGIAEKFGISIEALALANGAASPQGLTIVVGEELQIPLCEVHKVVTGNTLAGIALSCGIALDDLVSANIGGLAELGSLNSIPLGFVLYIPQASAIPEDLDCEPLPEREQVIEYSPGSGEGIFCLSQKYGISTATILRANADRFAGDVPYGANPLLIPPADGALYRISAEDIENTIGLDELAEWYEVEAGAISDWNGNSITEPLMSGQQLLIFGANLNLGSFRFQQAE